MSAPTIADPDYGTKPFTSPRRNSGAPRDQHSHYSQSLDQSREEDWYHGNWFKYLWPFEHYEGDYTLPDDPLIHPPVGEMETAVRWSQNSTDADQRFLLVDVVGRSLKLCQVKSWDEQQFDYDVVATHTKVPAFRAFDWSPTNEALVAVGQSSGEATVLRIDDGSQDTFSLPIRNQRYCNAVAFSTQGLLAAGLDKVRNDFCLNIWDLNQRLPSNNARGFSGNKQNAEPAHKLASSEPITSVKFFQTSPEELVAGVKGQFVRIYDLRQAPGNPSLQFATRCVHNLAIDSRDENYIASCYPVNDPTVCVWDKRASSRLSTNSFGSINQPDSGQLGSALELRNVIDTQGSIWSLRFAKSKRGCLGILSSTGHFKTYDIGKEYVSEDEKSRLDRDLGHDWASKYPEQVYTKAVQDVQQPFYHKSRGRAEKERIVSFDFVTSHNAQKGTHALTLSADGQARMLHLVRAPFPKDLANDGSLVRTSSSMDLKIHPGAPQIIAFKKTQRTSLGISSVALRQKRTAGRRPPSSVELHESLFKTKARSTMDQALASFNLRSFRCREGYRFDCGTNIKVAAQDRWLQGFWSWVERARAKAQSGELVYDGVDLNYLGVHAIWMDDLGRNDRTRKLSSFTQKTIDLSSVTKGLAAKLQIPAGKGCDTNFPAHRQLCLHTCGLAVSVEELETVVKRLVSEGQHTKAAALAVFSDEPKLAYHALRNKNSNQAHKMLAMAIAGAARGAQDDDWEETCASLAEELTDPYARAILALVRKGEWDAVIEETSLPLKYRVGVALRWLSDRSLTAYIGKVTREAIRHGDIEGIVLTGLSHLSLDLFQNYIRKFHDLQTAVLALSFTVPRYVDEEHYVRRFESWRATYREQLNAWGLKTERVRFDIQSRKLAVTYDGQRLIPPAKDQISLVCNYCSRSTSRGDHGESRPDGSHGAAVGTTTADTTHLTERNRLDVPDMDAAAVGTVCPKCRKHLPRCSICLMWLGMPDPSYIRNATNMAASISTIGTTHNHNRNLLATTTQRQLDNGTTVDRQDLLGNMITFCASCGHGYHADHASEWFAKHRVCPVADCACVCARA